jgi:hypothetical protein
MAIAEELPRHYIMAALPLGLHYSGALKGTATLLSE